MASETGHAKNAANFEEIVSVCKGYGAVYNPANTNLKITSLETLLSNTKAAIGTLNYEVMSQYNGLRILNNGQRIRN